MPFCETMLKGLSGRDHLQPIFLGFLLGFLMQKNCSRHSGFLFFITLYILHCTFSVLDNMWNQSWEDDVDYHATPKQSADAAFEDMLKAHLRDPRRKNH